MRTQCWYAMRQANAQLLLTIIHMTMSNAIQTEWESSQYKTNMKMRGNTRYYQYVYYYHY